MTASQASRPSVVVVARTMVDTVTDAVHLKYGIQV